jgi:1-acyl-sn-glycerol-3-phosphate acyltransferase
MLIGASVTLVLLVLRFPYQRVHMWVTAPLFAQVVRLATIRLRVHYHRDFDPDTRSVFCQNHINLLDGHVASAAIPHAFSGLMNAWQFKIPIYGWLMSMSKGIPIHRTRRDKIIEQISAEARNRKEIGMSILTFPEGHRTQSGRPGPFRRGVFLMARNAGMPIVPIAVVGLYDANNKTMGWRFAPFKRVDVFVGPQFDTAAYSEQEIGRLAEEVHTWTLRALEERAFPKPDMHAQAAE